MRKKRIAVVVCLLFVCAVVTSSALLLPPTPYEIVGEYDGSAWSGADTSKSAYEVGLNENGKPAFIDPQAALKQAKSDFSEGFRLISRQHNLLPAGYLTYHAYKNFGWQIQTEDAALKDECVKISGFFDIYENSYPRK